MVTELSYCMTRTEEGHLAKCREISVESMGRSPDEAVGRLREAILEYLASDEAVAPPTQMPSPSVIKLVLVVQPERDSQGPGDCPEAT